MTKKDLTTLLDDAQLKLNDRRIPNIPLGKGDSVMLKPEVLKREFDVEVTNSDGTKKTDKRYYAVFTTDEGREISVSSLIRNGNGITFNATDYKGRVSELFDKADKATGKRLKLTVAEVKSVPSTFGAGNQNFILWKV